MDKTRYVLKSTNTTKNLRYDVKKSMGLCGQICNAGPLIYYIKFLQWCPHRENAASPEQEIAIQVVNLGKYILLPAVRLSHPQKHFYGSLKHHHLKFYCLFNCLFQIFVPAFNEYKRKISCSAISKCSLRNYDAHGQIHLKEWQVLFFIVTVSLQYVKS